LTRKTKTFLSSIGGGSRSDDLFGFTEKPAGNGSSCPLFVTPNEICSVVDNNHISELVGKKYDYFVTATRRITELYRVRDVKTTRLRKSRENF